MAVASNEAMQRGAGRSGFAAPFLTMTESCG
jgi:hypothetical protein